jgi:hypothetical protein
MRFSLVCRKLQKKLIGTLLLVFLSLLLFVGQATPALAGFGISPPYVNNQQLTPGSKYVQQITLLRSSAEEELKAELKVNAPEIASWITIDKGTTFNLPKDQVQVPMNVTVNVPKDATLGNYKGSINIRITSANQKTAGVAIALGARLDIDLNVTNVANADFVIKVAGINNFEELKGFWHWWIFRHFLNRVPVVLSIQNIGNVKTGPSKVTLDISDITNTRVLEKLQNTSIEEVDPFSSKEVTAYLPTNLSVGQYWGKIKIYKYDTIVNSYDIAFSITEPGALGGNHLGFYPWLLVGIYSLTILVIISLLIYFRSWRLVGKILLLLLLIIRQPFKPLWRKLKETLLRAKVNFWRWLSLKVSQYNDNDDDVVKKGKRK